MRALASTRWLVCATALGTALLTACADRPEEPSPTGMSVAEALGPTADAGFARALEPRPFEFPQDHGPHPDFRTEWWYLTGQLETGEGRHFGYQATFFRTALAPEEAARSSAWATTQLYMAHFALTDTAGRAFHSFERFGRGAMGLAGATGQPLRVWLEDWELSAAGPMVESTRLPPLSLRLAEGEIALDLRLAATKQPVLHGVDGLSAKGSASGNASYYYSYTRLEARGTVRTEEGEHEVNGAGWMDREWSTSVLEPGTTGWDWLSLQLDDGSDLMFFRLRRGDGDTGELDGFESGTLIYPDAASRSLARGEVELRVLDRWTSPRTGAVYPSRWRLLLPAEGIDLEIRPRVADQELAHTFAYWEGAVTASGARDGREVSGAGYVELTGYASGGAPRGGSQG